MVETESLVDKLILMFNRMYTLEFIVSVVIVGIIISVLGNYATRLMDKGFLKSIILFNKLKKNALNRKVTIEEAKERAAFEMSQDPQSQWLALLISLRAEIRTVLAAIGPIFLTIITFHYVTDKRMIALIIVPLTYICILVMKSESRKAIHWAQILGRSAQLSKIHTQGKMNE